MVLRVEEVAELADIAGSERFFRGGIFMVKSGAVVETDVVGMAD